MSQENEAVNVNESLSARLLALEPTVQAGLAEVRERVLAAHVGALEFTFRLESVRSALRGNDERAVLQEIAQRLRASNPAVEIELGSLGLFTLTRTSAPELEQTNTAGSFSITDLMAERVREAEPRISELLAQVQEYISSAVTPDSDSFDWLGRGAEHWQLSEVARRLRLSSPHWQIEIPGTLMMFQRVA